MQLNPTCGWFGLLGKDGCSDQFKFNCTAVATEEYNCLRFSENASTGVITLRWSLTQSRMPIIRPDRTIGGSMVVVPSSTGGKVRYRGNKFPKQELYYFIGSSREVLFQLGQSSEPNGMSQWGDDVERKFHTNWV
jgi:hypothetical protein